MLGNTQSYVNACNGVLKHVHSLCYSTRSVGADQSVPASSGSMQLTHFEQNRVRTNVVCVSASWKPSVQGLEFRVCVQCCLTPDGWLDLDLGKWPDVSCFQPGTINQLKTCTTGQGARCRCSRDPRGHCLRLLGRTLCWRSRQHLNATVVGH